MSVTIDSVTDLAPDEIRKEYLAGLSQLLFHAQGLWDFILKNTKDQDVPVTVGVVGAVLQRVIECGTSITVLADHERFRDVAVLLLNLMELRVDLQFIALSPNRESEWLTHTNEWRKPWKLDKQLPEIFANPKELQAEKDMYHTWSMIKHGSPAKNVAWRTKSLTGDSVHSSVAFNITCDGTTMILDPGNLTRMGGTLLFATGYNIGESCSAAERIVARRGLASTEIKERVSATLKHLHTIIAKECLWKMVQWARQHDPEFDSICSEEKRLRIEIEQIQRRIQLADNEKGEQNLPDAAKSTI